MSFYVKRTQHGDAPNKPDGSIGYTGPIRSRAQAEKEREAWEGVTRGISRVGNALVPSGSYGQTWTAEVLESTPAVRADVRAWTKAGMR